jgi:transposase-like protein
MHTENPCVTCIDVVTENYKFARVVAHQERSDRHLPTVRHKLQDHHIMLQRALVLAATTN